MKDFILLTSKVILVILSFIFIIFYSIDGYDDPHYLRFTTSKKKSLIIGDSRSAFGLRPDILNNELSRNDIYNFSFDIHTSPFGKIYYEKIKEFLEPSNDGLFIISVTPYSLSNYDPFNADKRFNYGKREYNRSLYDTPLNLPINLFYLLKYFEKKYHSIFTRNDTSLFLHHDGWLENKKNYSMKSINELTMRKIDIFENRIYERSDIRIQYLDSTISFLKNYGEVILVRLPIHPKFIEMENKFFPEFENEIGRVKSNHRIKYLSMINNKNNYSFFDGNHLSRESATKFSKDLKLIIFLNI